MVFKKSLCGSDFLQIYAARRLVLYWISPMFCRARREGIESARGNAVLYLVLYKDFFLSGSHGSPAAPGLTSVRA